MDNVLMEAYEWAVDQDCSVRDLLQEDNAESLIATLTSRA